MPAAPHAPAAFRRAAPCRTGLRPALTAFLLAPLLTLSACGGGDDPPDPYATGREALPLKVGDQWRFRSGQSAGTVWVESERTMTVTARSPTAEGTVVTVDGWRFQFLDGASLPLLLTPAGELVRRPTAQDSAFQQAIGARVLLRLPLTAGDRWTQVDAEVPIDRDADLDGQPDRFHVVAQVTVEATPPLDLPAGRTPPTLMVTTTETQEDLTLPAEQRAAMRTTVIDRLWIVPGVGPVQRSTATSGGTILRPPQANDLLLSLRLAPAS